MKFYKYHGAGNDFLIADGRDKVINLTAMQIAALCERRTGIGADGVMVLERSAGQDFRMRYYNSDGSGGMMCGNGGRCIVAFAADLGYAHFSFEAPDGIHEAELPDSHGLDDVATNGVAKPFSRKPRIVRLKMKDVVSAERLSDTDWFLDTGTRHLVRLTDDLDNTDVVSEGRRLRYDSRFSPQGTNVNFVRIMAADEIAVRTYEKGVEDETLACGTGIVASALASCLSLNLKSVLSSDAVTGGVSYSTKFGALDPSVESPSDPASGPSSATDVSSRPCKCRVHARIADLMVEFVPKLSELCQGQCGISPEKAVGFSDVWLTGPAAYVGSVDVEI